MEEKLVTYKTAILAKEKGFQERTKYGTYGVKVKLISEASGNPINWNSETKQQKHSQATSVPTQSFLQKWLRENHDIHCWVEHKASYYFPWVDKFKKGDGVGKSFEEALEIALQEGLKLIK